MWKKIKAFFKWAMEYPYPEKKEEASAIIRRKVADDSWRNGTVWEQEEELERARDKKGQYRGDDKSTPDLNEAWVGGSAPSKSGLHKKKGNKKRK
jgi:predicted HNH restriction endonuclease